MRFIITENHDELSEVMVQMMLKHMHSDKERVNISITTGSTPVKAYEMLAKKVKNKKYFEQVHYYIFDEFWYKGDNTGICRASLDKEYFKLANVKDNHIHNLDDGNVDTFDEDIKKVGGLDMTIMGIGENGHFCGNQPGTFNNWNVGTHKIDRHCIVIIEDLLEFLLKDDLDSTDQSRIPDYYISMGPKTVMDSKSIVFILSGKRKAEVAKKAFFGPITRNFPASIFQLHQDVTVILDQDAASEIAYLLDK